MPELLPRNLLSLAREAMDTFPAIVIQGARQVGKSTFAQMIVHDRPYIHISLDDQEYRTAAQEDPRSLAELMPSGTVVIDEIQRDLNLTLALKSSIDSNRRPGRFILTGSSDLLRLTRNPDSLAGRAITIDLYGLSQGEILGKKEDFATWVRTNPDVSRIETTWTRDDYVSALCTGGYPEVRNLKTRMRNLWLDSYIERVLSRDVGDVSRGLSADRLAAVLRLIAANQSGEMVQTRLASSLGMPKSSISAYVNALKTMYLTTDLPPWGVNLTSREVSRHKVSVTDSAIAMRLDRVDQASLVGVNGLVQSKILGGLLEGFVVSELFKQSGWSEQSYNLYHFRDSDGLEVDVVMEFDNGDAILIEVKAASTYGSNHTAGIRALAKRLGDRFLCGIVLGTSNRAYVLGDRIIGLPISFLWEHSSLA